MGKLYNLQNATWSEQAQMCSAKDVLSSTRGQSCIATAGNTLVIVVIALNKEFYSIPYALITNLAVADIGTLLMIICGTMINTLWLYLYGINFQETVLGPCEVLGFLTDVVVTAEGFSLAGIAINRYILIVHNKRYSRWFSRRSTYFWLLSIWLVAVLVTAPPFLGWGAYHYDPYNFACKYSETSSVSFTLFLNSRMMLTILLMLYCYSAIFIKVWWTKRKVRMGGTSAGGVPVKKEELSLLRQFAVVFGVYLVFLALMFAGPMARAQGHPIHNHVLIVVIVFIINCSINPAVYLVFNSTLRQRAGDLLRGGFCPGANRTRQIQPNGESSSTQAHGPSASVIGPHGAVNVPGVGPLVVSHG